VLCLHGGPGVPHDYLEPLEALADTGRRVVFYDQLGCGRSDQPHDPALWTVDLFRDELATVRRELSLREVHLYGQSWGGMLALEHALRHPPGLRSLLLADTPASMPQWIAETQRLRNELPLEIQEVLDAHEAAGTTERPEYVDAMMVFYRRHVCRLDPWPPCVQRSFEQLLQNMEVYATMIGPSEFHITGTLRDWDVSHRLGEIDVPTLVIGGRYDEATPAVTGSLARGIRGAEWVLLEQSSHMGQVEEPERYLQLLTHFLKRVESPS
jgi:proline-specific peptidase